MNPSVRRGIVFVLALAAAVLAAGPAAAAVTKEDIVKPLRDEIELFREALAEVARQAQIGAKQLEESKAWLVRCREGLAVAAQRQKEEDARLRAVEERFAAGAASLVLDPAGNFHVPHFGWGVASKLSQHRDQTNAAIADAEGKIASGDASFNIPGLGWTTGKQLDASIAAADKKLKDFQAQAAAGEFQISYPGLGWVKRTGLDAAVADREKRIADTIAVIDKGEYQVNVPNVGWITRNGLQALMQKDRDELAALTASFQKEEAQISRVLTGWMTLKQLHAAMDGLKKQADDVRASVGAGSFQDNLASFGWTSGAQLQAAIAAEEKGIADVRASLAAETYQVPLPGGAWVNAKQIREALKAPSLQPAARAALEKGLTHIPTAAQVDISVRELGLAKLKGFLAALPTHAQPWLDRLAVELGQRALLQSEFAGELEAHRKRIERHLRWLESLRAFIPA